MATAWRQVDQAIAIIVDVVIADLRPSREASGVFFAIHPIRTVDQAIAIIIDVVIADLRTAREASGVFFTIHPIRTVDQAIAIIIDAIVADLGFRHAPGTTLEVRQDEAARQVR